MVLKVGPWMARKSSAPLDAEAKDNWECPRDARAGNETGGYREAGAEDIF